MGTAFGGPGRSVAELAFFAAVFGAKVYVSYMNLNLSRAVALGLGRLRQKSSSVAFSPSLMSQMYLQAFPVQNLNTSLLASSCTKSPRGVGGWEEGAWGRGFIKGVQVLHQETIGS